MAEPGRAARAVSARDGGPAPADGCGRPVMTTRGNPAGWAGSRPDRGYAFFVYIWLVRFALLGEIEATAVDGQPIVLGAPQQRSVLATLLLEPNRAVPATRLIEAVWDRPPPTALKALHGYVH